MAERYSTGQVVKAVGLPRDLLHYLTKIGHLTPERMRRGSREFLYFDETALTKLRRFASYYNRGLSVQRAIELAAQEELVSAFVLAAITPAHQAEVFKALKGTGGVVEVAATHGPRNYVIINLRVAHTSDLDEIVMRQISPLTWVQSTRTFIVIGAQHWLRPEPDRKEEPGVLAYVLIDVAAPNPPLVVEELKSTEGVREVCGVYGDVDVIAKVEVKDLQSLDEIVIGRIQKITGVLGTTTLIAIQALHWRRPD